MGFNGSTARRGPGVYIKITISELCKLFNRKESTIRKWIYSKLLNPYDLKDIIHKYNNPHLLDRRKKNKEIDEVE